MGVQVPEGHLMPDADIDPAASEREEFDLDCAECGTQAAEFSGSQILGEGGLRLDRREERGDDPRLHQEPGDSRSWISCN